MTASTNIIVDNVKELLPATEALLATRRLKPTGQYMTVGFKGGRSGMVDTTTTRGSVWVKVLDSLRRSNEYAYVEIDRETNIITELLLPLRVRVGAVEQDNAGDRMRVELIISHARHYLKRANPDFKNMLATLQTAKEEGTTILVTETQDSHEIVDVRTLPQQPQER